jgi:SET domain
MRSETGQFSFVLKPSEHGVGVFATHDIQKGTHLRLFVDEETTMHESVEIQKNKVPEAFWGHCLDRGDTLVCPSDFGAIPIGWYVNHSSEANAAPGPNPNTHRKYRWYTIRDIKEGEEILFNYLDLEEPGKYFYNL